MTPHRSHGRGTLILKVRLRGIGRIERASGTNDPQLLERMRAMVRELYDAGRDDVLVQLRDGEVKLRELWRVYRAGGRWEHLPTPAHAKPLRAELRTWAVGARSRRALLSRNSIVRRFLASAGSSATLGQVAKLLETYRVTCADRPDMFAATRTAVLSLLRQRYGRSHQLYQQVRDIELLRLPRAAERRRHPQTVPQAWVIAQSLAPHHGRAWWTLCLTGMRPDEYFSGRWSVRDGVLHVRGTKTDAADRVVPLVTALVAPQTGVSAMQAAMRQSGLGVVPYDARRSYAGWLEEAGIVKTRRRLYLGHASRDVTDRYELREVLAEHLEGDTTRFRGWLTEQLHGVDVAGLVVGQASV